MKKRVLYYVQDAYGYLCSTDELGFNLILDIWRKYECNFEVVTEDKSLYLQTKKLFRK